MRVLRLFVGDSFWKGRNFRDDQRAVNDTIALLKKLDSMNRDKQTKVVCNAHTRQWVYELMAQYLRYDCQSATFSKAYVKFKECMQLLSDVRQHGQTCRCTRNICFFEKKAL